MWKKNSQKGELKSHNVIHTALEELNKFIICKNSFSKKGNLNRHMVIHSGVKSYECNNCNKSFLRKDALSEHMVVHTNITHNKHRPFKFDICTKYF